MKQREKRIRVVFAIDNMHVGGTELNAVRTAERLDRSRFQLEVVCLRSSGPLLSRYQEAGIPVHSFPIPNLYTPPALRQSIRLRAFLRSRRVDVFHAHDMYSNQFGVPTARLAGVPAVIASRRWWESSPSRLRRDVHRLSYHFAHRVLANSPAVGELVRAEGVPAERVVVVPNFLDEEAFVAPSAEERARDRSLMGIPADALVVGIVANLRPVKDHASLLRAAARLVGQRPRLHLLFIGEGECRPRLEALARELGIGDRIHMPGSRTGGNYHHLFDISVLCSRSEGLSNSLLEAMAAGRPVVATAVGANADAVVNGQTGILVPAGDTESLANALERLLARPDARERLGAAGRRRAEENYSATAALSRLETVYEEVLGRVGHAAGAAGALEALPVPMDEPAPTVAP